MNTGGDGEAQTGVAERLYLITAEGTMEFMFEISHPRRVTGCAVSLPQLQADCVDCWRGLEKRFDPTKP